MQIGTLPTKLMQRSELTIVNDKKSEVKTFSVCATEDDMNATAIIQVGNVDTESQKKENLPFVGELEGTPDGITCYTYDLLTPLKHKETRKLAVLQITTNHLKPYPKERKQSESPKVLVTIPETIVSCYNVEEEESSVMMATSHVVVKKAGKRDFEQQKQTLQLATQKNVAPFSADIFQVQVIMNQPIVRARSVIRDIHVSHWGHVRVKEVYDVINDSPSIKGEFSRLQTMMNPEAGMQGAAHTLKAKVPAAAFDIRYRDEIGNISTSRMASSGSWIALALEPRFPLFGGWSAHFILEYSVGLDAMVDKKSSGRYSVSFLSIPSIVDMMYDYIETRIHLPGGAQLDPNVRLELPGTLSVSKEFTYLSMLPSPVLTVVQKNAVTEMSSVVVFEYGYQDILKFEKIAVATLSLAGIACCIAIVSSIDLYRSGKSKTV